MKKMTKVISKSPNMSQGKVLRDLQQAINSYINEENSLRLFNRAYHRQESF